MNTVVEYFLYPLSPILSPILASLLIICAECLPSLPLKTVKRCLAALGMVGTLFFTWCLGSHGSLPLHDLSGVQLPIWLNAFAHSFRLDHTSLLFFGAIGLFTLLSLVFMEIGFERSDVGGEILILMLFIAVGMMLLVSSDNLIMIFLALELLSLPTYVLVGIRHRDRACCEAALKYFLFGSFATVLLVFGIALLYAQFGTLEIPNIASAIQTHLNDPNVDGILAYSGLALIIIAVGFKMGIVPFHMWVPDAYQGAPTPVTGFMGSAVKLAAFGLAIRLLWGMFLPIASHWTNLLNWLAVITMFVGNLAALVQDNLKRLFAYSSVSHAGYLLLGLSSIPASGPDVTLIYYYLVVYGLMFLGFFAILALLEQQTNSTDITQLSGLGWTFPVTGACLALFSLSAAGIPPTAGFFAKYFVFLQAVNAGNTGVVVLSVISSMIGVYYYLRVLVYLYMKDGKDKAALPSMKQYPVVFACILACALSMIYFAISPVALGLMAP